MKDKEMIEEMVKILEKVAFEYKGYCINGKKRCPFDYKRKCCECAMAHTLYEQGYRKLPEDSVVLLREEYEKLTAPRLFIKPRELNQKELAEKLKDFNYGIIGVDESSIEIIPTRAEIEKETAEKILKDLIKNCQYTFGVNGKPIIALDGDFALNTAKQFGVEIKE